jgi:CheY-like chemotaxis protein
VLTHSGSVSIAEAARIEVPDIILADYHLDGETGLDLIRELRTRFAAAVPAVLVTADRSNEVRAAADLMDIPVVHKPLKPAVLRSLITRMRRTTPAAAE